MVIKHDAVSLVASLDEDDDDVKTMGGPMKRKRAAPRGRGGSSAKRAALSVVNPVLQHRARQISVLINGVSLESKTDDYAYKAYFRDLLNTDKEEGQSFMHLQGWYNEVNFPPLLDKNTVDSTTPHNSYKEL